MYFLLFVYENRLLELKIVHLQQQYVSFFLCRIVWISLDLQLHLDLFFGL